MSARHNKSSRTSSSSTAATSHVVAVQTQREWLFYPEATAPAAEQRFSRFIETVISRTSTELAPIDHLICCAIAFESLTSIQSLLGFLQGLTSITRRGDNLHVTWIQDGQLQRRSISALTAIAATAVLIQEVQWEKQVTNMSKVLDAVYPEVKAVPSRKLLTNVLADSVAWAYLHMLPACFAYLTGYLSLALLPESVHNRSIGIRPSTEVSLAVVKESSEDTFAHTKDLALEVAFNDRAATNKTGDIVRAMKSLVAERGGSDSPRSADFKDKDLFRQRLGAIGTALMRAGCPIDALLLSWEIYLIESGTVRLRNPKISTVQRYIHVAAEVLYYALHRAKTAPADMTNEEWVAFFSELIKDEKCSNELRCALASFHYFLVDQFGIEPIPALFFGVAENCTPAANVVWPHEIAAAKQLIDREISDPRLQEMLRVMQAVGVGNKVRIGEVRSLRLCNIRIYDDKCRLEIQIAPSRSHHQGKSTSAKRTLDYSDAEDRQLIIAWLEKRRNEGADENDLFFGDPHNIAAGYRLGTCQRLLNKILQAATGDATVSFHTLRHTNINGAMGNALPCTDHSAISSVHRITAEAGHQNERTTFEHYFHHPEPVIRFWVDKATASHLTAKALAPWIGKSPDALRQGHHRSTDKDCYLSDQLTQRALALYTPTQPTLPVELFAAKSLIEKTVRLNFTRLRKIVFDVAGGYQMSAIMSRNTVDEDQLVKACRAIAYVSSALEARHRKRHPLLSPNANNESCLEYAHDAIRRHRLDFSVGSEPHLDSMLGMLASKETLSEELSAAANAWIRCREGNYISLVDVNEALPLIKLLHTAAVPIANLIIRIQLADPKDENCVIKALESADLIAIRSAFEQVFTAKAHLEGVNTKPDASVRTDRPKQYLLISRHRLKSGRSATSAGCRMNRFHGIMFTLAVMASLGKVA